MYGILTYVYHENQPNVGKYPLQKIKQTAILVTKVLGKIRGQLPRDGGTCLMGDFVGFLEGLFCTIAGLDTKSSTILPDYLEILLMVQKSGQPPEVSIRPCLVKW